jgi:hypothetical protein
VERIRRFPNCRGRIAEDLCLSHCGRHPGEDEVLSPALAPRCEALPPVWDPTLGGERLALQQVERRPGESESIGEVTCDDTARYWFSGMVKQGSGTLRVAQGLLSIAC